MSTALQKAQERLAEVEARIRRADDAGRRHTVKMIGDLAAARHAVEALTVTTTTVATKTATSAMPTLPYAPPTRKTGAEAWD